MLFEGQFMVECNFLYQNTGINNLNAIFSSQKNALCYQCTEYKHIIQFENNLTRHSC